MNAHDPSDIEIVEAERINAQVTQQTPGKTAAQTPRQRCHLCFRRQCPLLQHCAKRVACPKPQNPTDPLADLLTKPELDRTLMEILTEKSHKPALLSLIRRI